MTRSPTVASRSATARSLRAISSGRSFIGHRPASMRGRSIVEPNMPSRLLKIARSNSSLASVKPPYRATSVWAATAGSRFTRPIAVATSSAIAGSLTLA